MPFPAGTKLGPYEIISVLGAGGMGEVYRGRDTRLDRTVAIKVLPSTFARDPDRMRRFDHEARALSALDHPNLPDSHRGRESDSRRPLMGPQPKREQARTGT
jgi:eukaryotic-like serine/threonine-protein kinase